MRVALVALALLLTGCASSHGFSSKAEGLAVSHPKGWTLSTVNHGYVPDPALCFDLSYVTATTIVDLRVVEYLPPYLDPATITRYKPRPRHFAFTAFRRGDEDWSPGKIQSFRDHGRVFFAGLVLPAAATTAMRRDVLTILDSLKISSHGRCRPTSGVGSHGVPAPLR